MKLPLHFVIVSPMFLTKALGIAIAFSTAAILFSPPPADAGITKIQIISRSPAFGGYSFPQVGTYERIIGKGFGELTPGDRHNNVIVDISLAPRNAKEKSNTRSIFTS